MAAKEMFDYLSAVAADYVATNLTIKPQSILQERGEFNQVVHKGDDASREVVTLGSTTPIFYVVYNYSALNESDIGTIFDFYFDTNKAYGMARSFQFTHPTDGHVYTVQFDCPMVRNKQLAAIWGTDEIRLAVLGYVS